MVVRFVYFRNGVLWALLLLCLLGVGCTCERGNRVGDSVVFVRADTLLFSSSPEGKELLAIEHAEFSKLWSLLLGVDTMRTTPQAWLQRFASDTMICTLQDTVERVFPSVERYNKALGKGLVHLSTHFPELEPPRVYYFNSGFNASVLVGEGVLGVGLDRFLGAESSYYYRLGVPRYLARNLAPAYLVSTVLLQYLEAEFPFLDPQPTLLDKIIDQGKKSYMVKKALGNVPDSLILPYTGQELAWLKENEGALWTYLSEHKLLFDRTPRMVSQLCRPGPFTPPLGQDSPGQAATYIGYRIVCAFMERHSSTSWDELLHNLDAKQLIEGGRYAPR